MCPIKKLIKSICQENNFVSERAPYHLSAWRAQNSENLLSENDT